MSDKVKKLQELRHYDGPDRVVSIEEYLELKKDSRAMKVLHSRFSRLDKTVGGFLPGELVVIGGPTGVGKTTLCLSLTDDFAEERGKSAWFSYEMPPERMATRLGENVPSFSLPLELEGSALGWIEERIMEAVAKHGVWAVFIDHLHYLIDMDQLARAKSTSLTLGFILRELKKIALRCEVVIFLVSHVRKFEGTEPSLSDLRDSSFTAQESDSVLLIWRDRDSDETYLKVAKNRKEGKFGVIPLVFKNNRLYERAEGEENAE